VSAPARVAAFVAALLITIGISAGIGAAVGPEPADPDRHAEGTEPCEPTAEPHEADHGGWG
jgi:hypothetical protein